MGMWCPRICAVSKTDTSLNLAVLFQDETRQIVIANDKIITLNQKYGYE